MPDIIPPFSPGLFAGLLARPIPDSVLNKGLSWALNRVIGEYPGLFNRLPENCTGCILIAITDLRRELALELFPPQANLRVATQADRDGAVAGISGSLQTLIDLLEGRVDGDALFFSRELRFEGDTEIVVALRNALDGIDIQIADLIPLPDFLSAMRTRLTGLLADLHQTAGKDLELIRSAATARLEKGNRQQSKRIKELEDRINELELKAIRSNRKAKA